MRIDQLHLDNGSGQGNGIFLVTPCITVVCKKRNRVYQQTGGNNNN